MKLVTPVTVGIETKDGTFTPVIPRNSPCPIRRTLTFTTVKDDQARVEVHVLEGESPRAEENRSITRFELALPPLAPKGVLQIEVAFEIDDAWNLRISATELTTRQVITRVISPSGPTTER